MKRLKIAYLSADSPTDMHIWSGTHHSIYQSLSTVGDVEILGPYSNSLVDWVIKLKKVFYKILFNKRYNGYHSRLLAKTYGRYFSKKVKEKNPDLIVAVSASAELAYLKTHIPVVFVSDALFSGTLNYNETLSNLCDISIREGFRTESRALNNATLCYLSSMWAINNAIDDFKISKNKVEIGYLGANLKNIPDKEFVFDYKRKKDNSFINIVFIGVDWEKKGGPKAYECLLELIRRGYDARLTVVGCQLSDEIKHPNIRNIQFIKKTSEEGRKKLEEVYLEADFLILPTLVDAYGIVFCEASAYGVISIAANTGGTSSPVQEDVNGYLMDPKSKGADYAEKIISVFDNKEKFSSLRISSRKRYDEVLNWNAWIQNLMRILDEKKIISKAD